MKELMQEILLTLERRNQYSEISAAFMALDKELQELIMRLADEIKKDDAYQEKEYKRIVNGYFGDKIMNGLI